MDKWQIMFHGKKPLIGMVHVQALPATPANKYSISEIIAIAVQEAVLLQRLGFDAILLENMHDAPYLNKSVGAEITAGMTAVAVAVRCSVSLPIGMQILAAANKAALAVALAAELNFIRVEGYVFGHVADEGYMDACAGELLRYRKALGAEHIAVYADIKKKHSAHSITADVSIGETASAAEFFRADGLIITGTATGKSAELNDLTEARKHSSLPILIGSGITDHIDRFWDFADGFIIGSYIKEGGVWSNPISEERCITLLDKVKSIR